jgi:hypothetical protein
VLFESNWRISQLLVVGVAGAVVVGVVVVAVGAGLVVALLIEKLAVDAGARFCFLNSFYPISRAKRIPGSMTILGPV